MANNLTITKISDGFFDFTDERGNNFGGNNIECFYDATQVYFKVADKTYTYLVYAISYDDGVEKIGFPSITEFISTLKTAGFTGNFNSAGATAQRKEAVYYIGSQDNTGFLDVEEKVNTIGVSFEFVREGAGFFSCANFDPSKHVLTSVVLQINFFANWTNDDFGLITYYNDLISGVSSIDDCFSFGGWIKIEEIN